MRGSHGRIEAAVACCAVEIVLAVPGFAQTNSGYRAVVAADRTSVGALREYVAEARLAPSSAVLPPNLVAHSIYKGLLQSMVRQSPTFRRQCLRIAQRPDLVVELQGGAGRPGATHVRARTRITRRSGQLFASIEVLRLEDPVELIAHEIEHIIEQLDGVDLSSRAGVAESGVRLNDGDHPAFETTRAIRVGLAVASEVRAAGG